MPPFTRSPWGRSRNEDRPSLPFVYFVVSCLHRCHGRQCEVIDAALAKVFEGEAGDHGGIVEAEGHVRQVDPKVTKFAQFGRSSPKQRVGTDAASDDQAPGRAAVLGQYVEGPLDLEDEDIDRRSLERCREVGSLPGRQVIRSTFEAAATLGLATDGIEKSCLETAEGEVERLVAKAWSG